jgi:ATP phosphoribosyltransferase regulatory subunit
MLLSRIPAGMRYYLGAEARLRRSVEDTAMSVFAGWSYEEVITPTVDYYALFEQGMGEEARRAFRFTDRDGGLLTMRPDVTSSVARLAETLLKDSSRPLRLCYAAPVFRQQQQSHVEWRRENTQLGCELIGASGPTADLETLLVAAEILARLGLRNSSCITINDVEIFNGLAGEVGVEDEGREKLRLLVDTRDVAELSRFLSTYKAREETLNAFFGLTQLTGNGEILGEARRLITNERSSRALESLGKLWAVIDSLALHDLFEIDLADVSSLDYYTGLSFKIFVQGAGYRIGRGGRYDGLTANFGRTEPAVGFVVNLDSLTEILGEHTTSVENHYEQIEATAGDQIADTFAEVLRKRAAGEQVRIEVGQ